MEEAPLVATRLAGKKAEEPQRLGVDVCVVGSGAAGAMAALTAARLGRRTAIVEAAPTLGGQAVGALLGTICGLYANGKAPLRVTRGAADELLAALHRQGLLQPRRARNSVILQYDETAWARWVETALAAAGVVPLSGAILRAVRRGGRRIEALALATRWGDVEVEAGGFVDASGDAAVAFHAGLAVREPETPIWGSQMIVLEGIDEAALAKMDRRAMQAVLKERGKRYGLRREDGFVFAFPGRGTAVANMTHAATPTDPLAAAAAQIEARAEADRLLTFLRAEFPEALGRARIRTYGQLGIRQTRWIVGARQLTADEVRRGERFPDSVARCAWPIELHHRAEGVHWEEFGDDHMHYVPLGSLVHRDADNLVAAGRCIDGDAPALSSVRVIGPCMAMGQAAAHILDLAGKGSVHQIDTAALAARLRDNLEGGVKDAWTTAQIEPRR
ncbi:MAG TPA: FAD-dependent oxidoreductase [Alphaproteobacteria bacterium]|jgi:flavin-dependent dehydrogenase